MAPSGAEPEMVGGKTPFDAKRAFADLEYVVGLGPRPSGSEAIEATRAFIRQELAKAGLEVLEQPFEAATPLGPKKMVNLTGIVQGSQAGIIILGNHYDTKYFADFTFVGANDAGSTTALMLEMARILGPRREGCTVWLCFFDGEEAFVDWSETDSLYGSRKYVERLKREGRLADIKAMINIDMIGDRYLGIKKERGAPKWLVDAVWNSANRLGYQEHFKDSAIAIQDDHVPFRKAGVPALDVIDFTYGRSPFDHHNNWHTPHDTLDKVCAASLQVVGDVIYDALHAVDVHVNPVNRD